MNVRTPWGTGIHVSDDGVLTKCGSRVAKETATDATCPRCLPIQPPEWQAEWDRYVFAYPHLVDRVLKALEA